MSYNLTVGCDPELFVWDTQDNCFVSAVGMVPGTKTEPHLLENGMVQVDGMALEFGTAPAPDSKTFIYNIGSVLRQIKEMIPSRYKLMTVPIAEFSKQVIEAQPPEALELGCDPDYNCYTLGENPRPTPPSPFIRSAGGHVHVGWGTGFEVMGYEHVSACAALVCEMDYRLGVPSLAWDKDPLRRAIYGRAGAFRPKSYGLEYRTLSNRWLSDVDLMKFVFDQTKLSFDAVIRQEAVLNSKLPFYNGRIKVSAEEVINNNLDAIGMAVFKNVQ